MTHTEQLQKKLSSVDIKSATLQVGNAPYGRRRLSFFRPKNTPKSNQREIISHVQKHLLPVLKSQEVTDLEDQIIQMNVSWDSMNEELNLAQTKIIELEEENEELKEKRSVQLINESIAVDITTEHVDVENENAIEKAIDGTIDDMEVHENYFVKTITKLRKKVRVCNEEIQRLKQSVESKQDMLNMQGDILCERNEQIKNLEAEIMELSEKEVLSAKHSLETARISKDIIDSKDALMNDLKERLKESHDLLNEKDNEISNMNEIIRDFQEENLKMIEFPDVISKNEAEILEKDEKISQLEEEKAILENNMEEMMANVRNLDETERSVFSSHVGEILKEKEISDLKVMVGRLTNELRRSKISQRKSLEHCMKQLDMISAENDELSLKNKVLTQRNELTIDFGDRRRQVSIFKQVKKNTESLEHCMKQLDVKSAENDELSLKNKELTQRNELTINFGDRRRQVSMFKQVKKNTEESEQRANRATIIESLKTESSEEMSVQCEKLNKENIAQNEEINHLKKIIQEKNALKDEMFVRCEKLNEENIAQNEEIKHLKRIIQEKNVNIDKMVEASNKEKSALKEEISVQCEKLNKENTAQNEEIKKLKKELEVMHEKDAKMQEMKANFDKMMGVSNEEKNALKEEFDGIKMDLTKVIESKSQKIKDKDDQLMKMQDVLDGMKANFDKMVEASNEEKNELKEEMSVQCEELNKENAAQNEEIKHLEQMIKKQKVNFAIMMGASNKEKSALKDEMFVQCEKLNKENIAQNEEINHLKKIIQEKNVNIDKMMGATNEEKNALKEEFDAIKMDLTKVIESKSQRIKENDDQLMKMQNMLDEDELLIKIGTMQSEIDKEFEINEAQKEENTILSSTFMKMDEKITELSQQNAALKKLHNSAIIENMNRLEFDGIKNMQELNAWMMSLNEKIKILKKRKFNKEMKKAERESEIVDEAFFISLLNDLKTQMSELLETFDSI